jgi:hypothetical protein
MVLDIENKLSNKPREKTLREKTQVGSTMCPSQVEPIYSSKARALQTILNPTLSG